MMIKIPKLAVQSINTKYYIYWNMASYFHTELILFNKIKLNLIKLNLI